MLSYENIIPKPREIGCFSEVEQVGDALAQVLDGTPSFTHSGPVRHMDSVGRILLTTPHPEAVDLEKPLVASEMANVLASERAHQPRPLVLGRLGTHGWKIDATTMEGRPVAIVWRILLFPE